MRGGVDSPVPHGDSFPDGGGTVSSENEWRGTPSWWNHFGLLLLMALIVVGAVALQLTEWVYKGTATWILVLAAFLLLVVAFLQKSSDRYRITNETVVAI